MNIYKHKALSSRRFSSLSYFGKWRHSANSSGNRRCVTFLFTLVLLFGSVFPVSAADDTASQTLDILGMSPSMYAVSADENTHSDYTSTMVTSLYTFDNGTENVLFKNTNNEYYAADRYKTVVLSNYITINPDTQYSVSFMHSLNNGSAYEIRVYCMVYSGSNITKIPIYSENFIGTYRVGNISDFSFKIPSPIKYKETCCLISSIDKSC